jgi:hypothetical protein
MIILVEIYIKINDNQLIVICLFINKIQNFMINKPYNHYIINKNNKKIIVNKILYLFLL